MNASKPSHSLAPRPHLTLVEPVEITGQGHEAIRREGRLARLLRGWLEPGLSEQVAPGGPAEPTLDDLRAPVRTAVDPREIYLA